MSKSDAGRGVPTLRDFGINAESIPEYFAKPGITEGLAEAHPNLLVRQMANEILRMRSTPSREEIVEECARVCDEAHEFQLADSVRSLKGSK